MRTALVTGSSVGIGAAIARRYAESGMRVMIHYRSHPTEARELLSALPGSGHAMIAADISIGSEAVRLVDETIEVFGRLDVLVNNAGVYEKQPFEMGDFDSWNAAWRDTLDTNLMSAVHASWAAIRHMKSQGGGKIINVASRSAFRAETEAPAYAVSKAGMVSLTRCMARALAKDGIRAYTIAPGWVETAMSREGMRDHQAAIEAEIPLGRIATVDDVAGVALFLASTDADYLTGITVDVNGGSYLH